jgi:hypothetical protein
MIMHAIEVAEIGGPDVWAYEEKPPPSADPGPCCEQVAF